MVYFDQIMHHSAGNDQFAFHTFLLAPSTDKSTLTTGRAHYDQLISFTIALRDENNKQGVIPNFITVLSTESILCKMAVDRE